MTTMWDTIKGMKIPGSSFMAHKAQKPYATVKHQSSKHNVDVTQEGSRHNTSTYEVIMNQACVVHSLVSNFLLPQILPQFMPPATQDIKQFVP